MNAPAYRISTAERARGRWREILLRLGLQSRFLQKRHGPCPICGGKDRYRFTDRDGSGSYFCNGCGPGVGIILVRKLLKVDHATACREIDKIIGLDVQVVTHVQNEPKDDSGKRLAAIERLLDEASDPGVVERYLHKRRITRSSAVLRGHRACPYYDDDHRLIGYYAAIIAPILGPDGALQSATRIYDADVEPQKKMLPAVATISGGAVRLHEPENGALGIAEGVETSLAAYELFGIPTWSVLNDGGIKAFSPPAGVKALTIFADNDASYAGAAAAYQAAQRIHRTGVQVTVRVPPATDTDWNDVLKVLP